MTVRIWLAIVTCGLILPIGCRQESKRVVGSGAALPKSQLSREELRQVLDRFEDYFAASIKQGASEIDIMLPGTKTQRLTLLWRTRCISALHTLVEQEDPLVAFVDVWALSLRMTLYFGAGDGSNLFGLHQEVALATATQIETEIERVAQTLLEPTIFEQTRNDLRAFAQANPIRGAFSKTLVYASEAQKGTPTPVTTVINLPLAPFRAIEGVDRGAMAIRDFSTTAERFSDIVEELPETTRWQLLLLLYDLEETEMVRSFLDSFERLAASSSKLTETSEKLPGQIRAELSAFIEQVDDRQANLQQTLEQTQATSEALSALIARIEAAAATLGVSAKDIRQTAEAWQTTVEAIGKTFNLPRPKPSADAASNFSLAELSVTAGNITETAMEIRKLNEELAANTGSLSVHIHGLITDVIWKLAVLIMLVFVLVVAYRVITPRLASGQRKGH
ncbi:MAG: hypothetical protein JSW27_19855 [Phycisphaerales bacterium]|nr:MAG: hypothetical protein JSW27_19855 [Phycisphaerales bacterium]